MEIQNSGLRKLPKDKRDFTLGGAGYKLPALSELPAEFTHDILGIKNQGQSDFCSAFSSCGASELQEGVTLVPEYTFAVTKDLIGGDVDEFGADLRSAMKSHVKVGAIEEKDRPQGFSVQEKSPEFLRRIENWLWVRSEKRRNLSMSRKTEDNIIAEGAASSPQAVST